MDFSFLILLICLVHDLKADDTGSSASESDFDSPKLYENDTFSPELMPNEGEEQPKFPEVSLTQVFDGKEGGEANQADIKINKFTNHEGLLTQNQFNGGVLNLALVHGEALIIDPKIKIKNESKIDKKNNTDDRFTNHKELLTDILAATDSSKIVEKSGKFKDTIYRIPFVGQPEDQKTLIQHHFFDGRQGMIMQNQYNGDYSALSDVGLTPHSSTTDDQRNNPSDLQHRKLGARHVIKSVMEKYQKLVDQALKDYNSGGRKSETISTGSSSFDLSKVLSQVKNMKIDPKNVRVQDYSITNGAKKLFFDETRLPLAATGMRPSTPIASNSIPNPIILTFPDIREAPVTSNTQTKSNNFYVADGGQAYQILLENPTINVNVISVPVVVPPENCPTCPMLNVTSTENGTTTTSESPTTTKKVVTTISPHATT